MRFSRAGVVYVLFVMSGATSLAYEVIWTRLLVRVFGATSLAVTTVLASYMAGLAIGSYLLGKWIDRRWSPLRVYGLLELGIGIFALIFPLLILALNRFYGAVYPAFETRYPLLTAVRLALCFLVLLIPTTLMGGTLPVLGKYVARGRSDLAGRIGALYALNTFGAVVGAVGTGYLLLPRFGINRSTWLCIALNVIIFGLAIAMSRGRIGRESSEGGLSRSEGERPAGFPEGVVGAKTPSPLEGRLVLLAFMLTGFAALSAEVLWTRVLSLVVGTTVYAFSTMLGTFLFGLALGSAVFARFAGRLRRPGLVLSGVVAAIGATIAATSAAFGRLPFLYMAIGQDARWVWERMMWVQFLICAVIMIIPTFLMGGTFPLVTRLYVRDHAAVGRKVGTAYAFNTIGSILGSFAGTLIFLRFLGIERGLEAISVVYLAVGLLLLVGVAESRRVWRVLGCGGVAVAGVAILVFSPHWDQRLMTTGVYRYAQTYKTADRLKDNLKDRIILFYNDGPGATVNVERFHNEIALAIDGKSDASTCIADMTTQEMLAHLPLLFHPSPDTVLVIGLGCGVSLGSAERYPAKSVECIELLDNVVAGSRFFSEFNHGCLADPRLSLVIADARNRLMLSRKRYDVIISEPSNPWISGVGDLFTKEFFEIAKRRLKPGGIMCIWFHTYHMGDSDLKAMVRTLLAVFPHNTMWMANESDVIFLGSLAPLAFDRRLTARFEAPAVRSDLERIGVGDLSDVLSSYVWGNEGLARYARGETKMHTDDNMMLEFSASRKIFAPTDTAHLEKFSRSGETPPLALMDPSTAQRVGTQMSARRQAMRGSLELLAGHVDSGIESYDSAYVLAPSDPFVASAYVEGHTKAAYLLSSSHDYSRALEMYLRGAARPSYQHTWIDYDGVAFCAAKLGDYARARHYYELSLEANPLNHASTHNLALLYIMEKDYGAAAAVFEKLLAISPDDLDTAGRLARVYASRGESSDKALRLAKMAAASGKNALYCNTLGWLYYNRGQLDEARKALKTALKIAPDDSETLYRLALVEVTSVNRARARRYLERLIGLGRQDGFTTSAKELLRELPAE